MSKKFAIIISSAILAPGATDIKPLEADLRVMNVFAKTPNDVFSTTATPTHFDSLREVMAEYNKALTPMQLSSWTDEDEDRDYTFSPYQGVLHFLTCIGYRHPFGAEGPSEARIGVNELMIAGTLAVVEFEDVKGLAFNIENCRILAQTKISVAMEMESERYSHF
jgi:hypothetical protein